MAAGPLSFRSLRDSPVVALIDLRSLEALLLRSGYRRIEPSRLGDRGQDISLWEGRSLFVILMPDRLVVGSIGSRDWRIRTNLDRIDPALLRFIRADRSDAPPVCDTVPDSGPWPAR
jgi:hypothetical protein